MREGEGTKFTIDRKIFSSDIWHSSPWKLKIWLYLLGKANHKDGNFMGIPIKRGQLIRSYRTIQKDCSYKVGYRLKKPSLSTISTICEELTKELRIERRSEHGGQVITILNYDELQQLRKNEANGEANDTRTIPERNKNVKNVKNNIKKGIDYPDWLNLELWKEFKKYRTKIKSPLTDHAEKLCLTDLRKVIDQGHQQDAIINQTIKSGKWKSFYPVKGENVGRVQPKEFKLEVPENICKPEENMENIKKLRQLIGGIGK